MIGLNRERKEQLKQFVKNRPLLIKLHRLNQNNAFFKKRLSKSITGKNNKLQKTNSTLFINCRLDIKGNNNTIIIEELGLFNKVTFFIRGNNNIIHIKKDVNFFRGGEFWIEDDNCKIDIGRNSTFEDVHLAVTEDNSKLVIGEDCMFAYGIDVRTGDSHSILKQHTLERVNEAENVVVGNHVWVGAHCSILKGSHILNNSVVATRSVVTKKMDESNIILAGIPAEKIKTGITWDRRRL